MLREAALSNYTILCQTDKYVPTLEESIGFKRSSRLNQ